MHICRNSQLRLMHFNVDGRGIAVWHARWVIEKLLQIDSNHLEEISLSLIWRDREPEFDWNILDMILTEPHFSKLRKIEIFYRGGLRLADIQERLWKCHARGILFLTDGPRLDYRGFVDIY